MKRTDMNSHTAYLFKATIQTLVSKEIISKGSEAARILGLTYQQYKNICSERTAITPKQWEYFMRFVREYDSHEYKWVLDKLGDRA